MSRHHPGDRAAPTGRGGNDPSGVTRGAGSRLLERLSAAAAPTLLVYLAVGAVMSFAAGQDLNWDLLNYHFYNPCMLVDGRIDRDVHVAGVQTFLNPLLDLPFFVVARHELVSPLVFGLGLGAFHGICLWLVHRLAMLLLPPDRRVLAWLAGLLAGVTSAFGAAFASEIGSSMGDNAFSVLVLAALVILLSAMDGDGEPRTSAVLLAGLLVGLAAGAKLVAAIYVISLGLVVLLARGDLNRRARRAFSFSLCAAAGFAITAGYWMWVMYSHFQSPLFPFYNTVFRSPFAPTDFSFGLPWVKPDTWAQNLFYPFFFLFDGRLVAEVPFRDARLAVGFLLVAAVSVGVGLGRWRMRDVPMESHHRRLALLALFWAASYVVWQAEFCMYRYAVPLELATSAMLVGCLAFLLRRPAVWLTLSTAACVLLSVTSVPPQWGRTAWSSSFFGVDREQFRPYGDATVVLADLPCGYLVPYFPESATFIRLVSNWRLSDGELMRERLQRRLAEADPERLFILQDLRGYPSATSPELLARFGLELDETRCHDFRSHASAIRLCRLRRTLGESTSPAARWAEEAVPHLDWVPVEISPSLVTTAEGARLTQVSDRSIMARGIGEGEVDVYELSGRARTARFNLVRLEALADPALPAAGPGRADNGNFVLSEVEMTVVDPGGEARVAWSAAEADFSQKGFPVAAAIDGDESTGWAIAPRVGADHVALLWTDRTYECGERFTLRLRLVQGYGKGHCLGRFRISLAYAPRP